VTSGWELIGGRRRRVYRVTSRGADALAEQRAAWRAFSRAVEAVVT
jgi:DNA-binding PadR family transcriptional regulator